MMQSAVGATTMIAIACLTYVAAAGAESAPSAIAAPRPTRKLIEEVSHAWFKLEWRNYCHKFLTGDGRIVDNGNGDVSHSEGQGYGMLLAEFAGDAQSFDLIWSWTRIHLQVRSDRLLAWRWDPKTSSAADENNASDGDILAAWALARAARSFNRPDYLEAARAIARSLGSSALTQSAFGPVLLPGSAGFSANEQPDGPVVNLSYWIFPAFPTLAELAPDYDWNGVARSGFALLARSRFGSRALPADWEALKGGVVAPAKNFPNEFGYNAIRIPLYLAWSADPSARRELGRFVDLWRSEPLGAPAVVNLTTGSNGQLLSDAGYRVAAAMARCATAAQPIDPDLIKTRDALYYPETLRMLALAALQERYPQCL
jgi:endoglucanase